jgi:uncharacterized protein (DUF1330 family)
MICASTKSSLSAKPHDRLFAELDAQNRFPSIRSSFLSAEDKGMVAGGAAVRSGVSWKALLNPKPGTALPGKLRRMTMTVYLISDVRARNAEALEIYRTRAATSIERHGGTYLARGSAIEVLEGDWRPRMIIIVEFPDQETARRWYASPDYAEALAVRDEALERNLIMAHGVGEAS